MTRREYRQSVLAVKDRINTFAAWFLRDGEEAADVTQDALLRLWQWRAKVQPEAAKPWLYRTTYRLCVDRIRQRNGRGETTLEGAFLAASDEHCTPTEVVSASERRREVTHALAEMSPRDRALLVLREYEGMSYERIAKVLECPIGTVKVRLHRARGRLRKSLTEVAVRP